MDTAKQGKNLEDVYSRLPTNETNSSSSLCEDLFEELPRLRHSTRTETLFRICQAATFLFLTCAFLYCYVNLYDLKYQVENLNKHLKVKMSSEKRNSKSLTIKPLKDEMETSFSRHMVTSQEKNAVENIGNSLKRKREITSWQEYTSDPMKESQDDFRNFFTVSTLNNKFSEPPQHTDISTPRGRKRRKGTRKPKKYHRHGTAAEKFYTELESSTSTAIQIRQSRTKETAVGFELGKHKRVIEHKPLLQVYGSKEFITIEEAFGRPGGLRNVNAETVQEIGKRTKSENFNQVDKSLSKELAEGVAYNIIMVHYAADTSHYSKEKDSNYCGNGRMQMKENIYKDWKGTHSTQGVDISKFFSLNRGEVTVTITGIYLIYAQVQYSNLQEVNGYEVIRNKHTVVQCITTSVHPDKHEIKSNTCDTSTTILLYAGDKIYIQDLHHGRHVVLKPEKSYFGLILLSPFKENKRSL